VHSVITGFFSGSMITQLFWLLFENQEPLEIWSQLIMDHTFYDYFRCPESRLIPFDGNLSQGLGIFRFGEDVTCYGQSCVGDRARKYDSPLCDISSAVKFGEHIVELPLIRMMWRRISAASLMRVIWANTKRNCPQPIVPRHLLLGTPAYVGAIPQNLAANIFARTNHQVFPALAG